MLRKFLEAGPSTRCVTGALGRSETLSIQISLFSIDTKISKVASFLMCVP
jgi:hypothetical protein